MIRIGRIAINMSDMQTRMDYYAGVFAAIRFLPYQITNSPLVGRVEYLGYSPAFAEVNPDGLIPAYDLLEIGQGQVQVVRKVIDLTTRRPKPLGGNGNNGNNN